MNRSCSYRCNLDGIDSIKFAVIEVECRRRSSKSELTPSGSSSFIDEVIVVMEIPAQILIIENTGQGFH